jgi:hypothetical protein
MSSFQQALTAVVGGVIGFVAGGFTPTGALYGFELGLLAGSLAFPTKLPGTFGPRLTDGQTTTASVGDPVNFGYGFFTTAGTVIYLGRCLEQSQTTSQGSKGAPSQSQTTYSYTQSIAIGLCEGPLQFSPDAPAGIGRIWENGELVYDDRPQQTGESTAEFTQRAAAATAYADTFVLYFGDELQTADPTIEADLGIGNVPAFRGLAYIMYPDRKLRDDQGQRHPSFKFEVLCGSFYDEGVGIHMDDTIKAIATRCGYDPVEQIDASSLSGTVIAGYAVKSVMSGRDVIAPLRSVALFDVVESGIQLKFVKRGGAALRTLTTDDLGTYDDPSNPDPAAAITVVEQQEVELPRQIRVSYISTDADYEAGQQLSPSRFDTDAINITDVELAVCMSDNQAKQIAEILWNDAWQSKDTYTTVVDQSNADIEPSDVLIVPMLGNNYRMRVDKVNDASQIMRSLTLISDDDGAYTSTAVADVTARPPSKVAMLSGTELIILDLPALQETDDDAGFYAVALGDGTGTKWSGCVLYKSIDGDTFAQVAAITGSAPIGELMANLSVGLTSTWDDENYIDVRIFKGEFESRTDDAVLAGANTIAVGADGRWEIIQFGTAVAMSDLTGPFFRLSHLLRGRRGSEQFVGTGVSPDLVIGLTMGSLFRVPSPTSGIGVSATYRAVTIGASFTGGTDQNFTPHGVALKPFSPVDLSAKFATGDLIVKWVRRDRFGLTLTSGVDIVMSEATESYQIDVVPAGSPGGTAIRTLTSTTPTVTYTAAQQAADFGTALTEYELRVYQMSAVLGRGYPVEATVP